MNTFVAVLLCNPLFISFSLSRTWVTYTTNDNNNNDDDDEFHQRMQFGTSRRSSAENRPGRSTDPKQTIREQLG